MGIINTIENHRTANLTAFSLCNVLKKNQLLYTKYKSPIITIHFKMLIQRKLYNLLDGVVGYESGLRATASDKA